MKRKIILMSLLFGIISHLFAQTPVGSFEYRPSFSAIVVAHADTSSPWYQSVFGLKVINRMTDENAGYKIIILESSSLSLELLELRNSLIPTHLLEGKPEGTLIQGHFKIGFKVPDMDACIKHLRQLKINIPQVWTDANTKKRNFLISDPDGNLLQFFE